MTEAFENMIEQYWNAACIRDWNTFSKLLHEHVLYELPQTRERVRGRDAYVECNANFPGSWTLSVESIVAGTRQAVSKIAFDTDDQTMTGITFFEFKDGLIARITDYWPNAYDPPRRMVQQTEPC